MVQVQMVKEALARRSLGQTGELEKELWCAGAEMARGERKAREARRATGVSGGMLAIEGSDISRNS